MPRTIAHRIIRYIAHYGGPSDQLVISLAVSADGFSDRYLMQGGIPLAGFRVFHAEGVKDYKTHYPTRKLDCFNKRRPALAELTLA